MQEIAEKNICSGCSACANACPAECIEMKYDGEGFLYPHINEDACINCGKCKRICPVLKEYVGNPKGKAYACINKDDDIRMQSSSGGVFTLLAEEILQNGGVVFGAVFDEDFNVGHIAVESAEKLGELRGSKYVQSRIGIAYRRAKKYLDNGTLVLFTGTPCQISGLRAFLGREYDNLIMQDIICHGVPSPGVWQRYIKYREKKSASATRRTFFRHKKYGWKTYSVLFEFSNSTEYEQILCKDLFMQGFLANLYLRPSCYRCHSKSLERESDITLADFWGIENVAPEMFDDRGTSLVLVNSLKGKKLFETISDKLICREVSLNEAVKYNSSAYKSVEANKKRGEFFERIDKEDFEKVVMRLTRQPRIKRCFIKIKGIIRKVCR